MAPLLATRASAVDRSFERLYRRHVGDVYRYSLAVLRNRDDAEDVTQTTFLNAYRAYQRGDRPDTPKNWLIAIAHNVCRQRFRQAQRRPQETLLFEDAAEVAVEEPEPEYTVEDIQSALSQIAFNQRAALVMRELEGRSYAEIAEIMGLTVGAVETLIFRGRRALREQLDGRLTCAAAELALSKQVDGALPRAERGQLRAHLRECKECATLARRQRATRGALKAIGLVPLPSSLASFFGGGGSAVATGVAAKAAAVVCAGAVVGGVAYEGTKHGVLPSAGESRVAASSRPAVVPLAPVVHAAAAETRTERAARAQQRPQAARPLVAAPARPTAKPAAAEAHAAVKPKRWGLTKTTTKLVKTKTKTKLVPPGAAVAQPHRKTVHPAYTKTGNGRPTNPSLTRSNRPAVAGAARSKRAARPVVSAARRAVVAPARPAAKPKPKPAVPVQLQRQNAAKPKPRAATPLVPATPEKTLPALPRDLRAQARGPKSDAVVTLPAAPPGESRRRVPKQSK
jgi:RNA polymerase sigma-70 factor (ECF subfamily)